MHDLTAQRHRPRSHASMKETAPATPIADLASPAAFASSTGFRFADINIFPPSERAAARVSEPGDATEVAAEQMTLQAMRAPLPGASGAPTTAVRADSGSTRAGAALDPATRALMEPRFGHNFGNVRVHADARAHEAAQALNARAFTVGGDVVFGTGQYAPGTASGNYLIAHELAHVVQQASGPLAIQRAVSTMGGDWDTDLYTDVKDAAGTQIGVSIDLKFTPKPPVDATKIGETQMVNSTNAGAPVAINPTVRARSIPIGQPEAGSHIDRNPEQPNPIYGTNPPTGAGLGSSTPIADPLPAGGTQNRMQFGFHFAGPLGVIIKSDAHLRDAPRLSNRGANASQIFETTALALEGTQAGTYYGSVKWGWQSDAAGTFTRIPLQIVSAGVPSPTFMQAAALWNTTNTSAGTAPLALPTSTLATGAVVPETLSTTDLVAKIDQTAVTIAAMLAGTDKTNLEFQKKAMEVVLGKRNAKIDVKVNSTEDWLGSDNVYVKLTGAGGAVHKTAVHDLNDGQSYSFLVPLEKLVPFSGPITVEVFDEDTPDADDLIVTMDWSAPYGALKNTGSLDDASYDVTATFER